MKREATLLIADDHPVFRRGLREIIEENGRFKVIGEADDGEAALRLMSEKLPDIVVVDIDMPRLNGLQMVREILRLNLPVVVVFLTMYNEEDVFEAAIALGAKGYILKENAAKDILVALDIIADGGSFISPSMALKKEQRSLRVQPLPLSKPQLEDLTSAERQILKRIAEDRTSKEIADELQISVRTVEKHRFNICNKLNLHGSHSLLKYAYDHKSHL